MQNKTTVKFLQNSLLLMIVLSLIAIDTSAQEEQVYDITLNYKKTISSDSLSLVGVTTHKGIVLDYKLNPPNFYTLKILSSDDELLKSMKFVVPIGAVMGLSYDRAQGTPEDLTFTISVPYFKNANLINIYDKDNNKILEIPLSSERNPFWVYTALPILLVIVFLFYVEFKRKKEHAELMQKIKQQNILSLKNYIMTSLRRGYSKEQIRNSLVKAGYNRTDIEEALRNVK